MRCSPRLYRPRAATAVPSSGGALAAPAPAVSAAGGTSAAPPPVACGDFAALSDLGDHRCVFAVLTLSEVLVYDTHQAVPLLVAKRLHFAPLTDAAWSADGKCLAVSSSDGYVSVMAFSEAEIGTCLERGATEQWLPKSRHHQNASAPPKPKIVPTAVAPALAAVAAVASVAGASATPGAAVASVAAASTEAAGSAAVAGSAAGSGVASALAAENSGAGVPAEAAVAGVAAGGAMVDEAGCGAVGDAARGEDEAAAAVNGAAVEGASVEGASESAPKKRRIAPVLVAASSASICASSPVRDHAAGSLPLHAASTPACAAPGVGGLELQSPPLVAPRSSGVGDAPCGGDALSGAVAVVPGAAPTVPPAASLLPPKKEKKRAQLTHVAGPAM